MLYKSKAVAIEVKTPVGEQSQDQIDWAQAWVRAGGYYIVARCIEDLQRFHLMKCPHCPDNNNRGLLMAIKNGKVAVYCVKHAKPKYKDPITDWMRLGKLKRVG